MQFAIAVDNGSGCFSGRDESVSASSFDESDARPKDWSELNQTLKVDGTAFALRTYNA